MLDKETVSEEVLHADVIDNDVNNAPESTLVEETKTDQSTLNIQEPKEDAPEIKEDVEAPKEKVNAPPKAKKDTSLDGEKISSDYVRVMSEQGLDIFTKELFTDDTSDEEYLNTLISDKHFGRKTYPTPKVTDNETILGLRQEITRDIAKEETLNETWFEKRHTEIITSILEDVGITLD